jgi:hypothetical protein
MGGACSTTAEQNYKPEEKVVVQEKVQAKSNGRITQLFRLVQDYFSKLLSEFP